MGEWVGDKEYVESTSGLGIIFAFWPFDWRLSFQREGRGFHANLGPFVLTVAVP